MKWNLPGRRRLVPETIIDHEGDLWLHVGTTSPRKFLIASKTLKLASSVLYVMLKDFEQDGVLTPSTTDLGDMTSIREMRLPDDKPDSMETILRFLHFLPTNLPKDATSIETALWQGTVICDKYDMVGALRKSFVPMLSSYEDCIDAGGDDGKWLYISWVWGEQDMFAELLERVIRHCKEEEFGATEDPSGEDDQPSQEYSIAVLRETLPACVSDYILSQRLKRLSYIIGRMNRRFQDLVSNSSPHAFTVLGAFVQTLHAVDVELIPTVTEATSLKCSVSHLQEQLCKHNKFKDFDKSDKQYFSGRGDPRGCLEQPWRFLEDVNDDFLDRGSTSSVPGEFSTHLSNQAAK